MKTYYDAEKKSVEKLACMSDFIFKTKDPLTDKQKETIRIEAMKFNKDFNEKFDSKYKKIPNKFKDKFTALATLSNASMISDVDFPDNNTIVLRLNDLFCDALDAYGLGLPKLLFRKEDVQGFKGGKKLVRNLLWKALNHYAKLVKD